MRYLAAMLAGIGLWGLAWWPIQALGAEGLDAVSLTLAANGTAALVMLQPALRRWPAIWRCWRTLLAIAVVGGCWNLGFVGAMAEGDAGRRILLYYLSSGWAILGGRVFLGEVIDGRRWASVVLAFGGACIVVAGSGLEAGRLDWADTLAILAGLAQAATNLLFRHAEEAPLCCKNAAMFLGSAVAAGGVMLLTKGWNPVGVDSAPWLAAALFGALWVVPADTLVQFGVSHLPAARSSVLMIAELPLTMVSAALIAGEGISGSELGGGLLIAAAALNELMRPIEEGRAETASSVGPRELLAAVVRVSGPRPRAR